MSILIVDDHTVFADALTTLLRQEGLDVLGHAATGSQAVDLAVRLRPRVVLLDVRLPDMDGIEVGRRILASSAAAAVIALSSADDVDTTRQAIDAGFSGYLLKQVPLRRLLAAIEAVEEGRTVLSSAAPHRAESPPTGEVDGSLLARQLSPREREVLELLAGGSSGLQIAREMGISANTVRTHIQNLLGKLQVHSRLEAVTFAVRHGLLRRGPGSPPVPTPSGPRERRDSDAR